MLNFEIFKLPYFVQKEIETDCIIGKTIIKSVARLEHVE